MGPVDEPARLRAVCELMVPQVRDSAGRHELDGVMPDLSPEAVRSGLAALGGPPLDDPHDEAHLRVVEDGLRVQLGEVELHRRNPRMLLAALDLSVYDRPYAPLPERAAARQRHLAAWPDGIAAALRSLDAVSSPAAQALLPAVLGAASGVSPDEPGGPAALAAHDRLVQHLEHLTEHGHPDARLGPDALAALLGAGEAQSVDLAALEQIGRTETERLLALLAEGCARLRPGVPPREVVAELVEDHAPTAAGVLAEARALTEETIAFTRERGLVEHLDGECVVEPSPPSRRWAGAMLAWAAPYEADAPSVYAITPPDVAWDAFRQRQWLRTTNRTTLPATTAHEVAPGHFAHGRALRRAPGHVRRTLQSPIFVEGWAHYAEELMVEEGFRAHDPRFAIGVAVKALMRVVRLRVALELHAGDLTLDEAVRLFETEAFLQGPAARAEAVRAVIDPTYGRYTAGKLALRDLREQAKTVWGSDFSLARFHRAVFALGAPPLGLLPHAVEIG
jgi:hypothetical protein